MDLVTRLRYRSSTDLYPRDTALTLMAEAADEIERFRALLTQAPIAKVMVREDGPADVVLYAPGLPPGEYDLYLMPSEPQSAPHAAAPDAK